MTGTLQTRLHGHPWMCLHSWSHQAGPTLDQLSHVSVQDFLDLVSFNVPTANPRPVASSQPTIIDHNQPEAPRRRRPPSQPWHNRRDGHIPTTPGPRSLSLPLDATNELPPQTQVRSRGPLRARRHRERGPSRNTSEGKREIETNHKTQE